MKKRIIKMFGVFLVLAFGVANGYATSVSISASGSVTKGNTVKVSVTVNADSGIYTIIGSASCSGAGASGGVDLSYDDMNTASKSKTYTFNIKPTASGTVTCSTSGVKIRELAKDSEYALNNASTTIKVVEPVKVPAKEYSSDNTLKSLSIDGYEISPKFNKDTLEYSLEVDESVEKIKISAVSNDSKATVKGIGEVSLTPGENKFEIKVTAENGNVKIYKVNVLVLDQNPIEVKVGADDYTIVKKNYDKDIKPENFEEITLKIDNQDVKGFNNEISKLTLVVLKDKEGNSNLYVYDEKEKKYYPYKTLKVGSMVLYIQDMEDDILPKGYSKYIFKVGEIEYTGYRINKNSSFDLIYAMNILNGEKSLYIYDEKEGTVQRYNEDMVDGVVEKYKSDEKKLYMIVSALTAVSVVLVIVLVIFIVKKKGKIRKNRLKI